MAQLHKQVIKPCSKLYEVSIEKENLENFFSHSEVLNGRHFYCLNAEIKHLKSLLGKGTMDLKNDINPSQNLDISVMPGINSPFFYIGI